MTLTPKIFEAIVLLTLDRFLKFGHDVLTSQLEALIYNRYDIYIYNYIYWYMYILH